MSSSTPAVASGSSNTTNGGQQQQQAAPETTTTRSRTSSTSSLANFSNPTPHVIPEGENATALEVVGATAREKLIIILVGLPGVGKTGIAQRICRYLHFFLDLPTQIFSQADYRRELYGAHKPASYYDDKNEVAKAQRIAATRAALADTIDFINDDDDRKARVAVFDGANITKFGRKVLKDGLHHYGIEAKRIFLEIVCEDKELLEDNIRGVKESTPDYKDTDAEEASRDYRQRREYYKSVYQPVEECEGSYIKCYDYTKFEIFGVRGYLPLKVVQFMMSLHALPRTFYFSRHGQSEYNLLGKIGGDAGLSKAGVEYARRLAKYAKETICIEKTVDDEGNITEERVIPARLWTSTLRRTQETSQFFEHPVIQHTWDNGDEGPWVQMRPMARRNLDELYAGACDGMTYKEIADVFPDEFARRQNDKLKYRYPRGESYMDVILRLEPLAHEMERTREPLLVIGHQGIIRILYSYFMGLSRDEAPYVSIPLNTIIKIEPHPYGCRCERICLMQKYEMVSDGQDEPVTSMPRKNALHDGAGAGAGVVKGVVLGNAPDPVMDAPSC